MSLNIGGSSSGVNGVRQFWFLLFGLAGALVMIGVTVALYITQNHHHKASLHLNPYLLAVVIVIIGIAGQVAVRVVEPPLKGTSDASLLATYRSRFFLWVGVGESPAFIGLAAALASNRFWLYPVGVIFAVLSYFRIAPTARHLARDQRQLDQAGMSRSLLSALASMPARRPRR